MSHVGNLVVHPIEIRLFSNRRQRRRGGGRRRVVDDESSLPFLLICDHSRVVDSPWSSHLKVHFSEGNVALTKTIQRTRRHFVPWQHTTISLDTQQGGCVVRREVGREVGRHSFSSERNKRPMLGTFRWEKMTKNDMGLSSWRNSCGCLHCVHSSHVIHRWFFA